MRVPTGRGPALAVRALIALLVLAALVTNAVGAAQEGTFAQNVSYFTNQSNLLFVVLLAAGLAMAMRSVARADRTATSERPVRGGHAAAVGAGPWDDLRGAVTFFLAMTGILYALLVAPLDELLRWDIGWTGIVLHRLAPVAAVADWLLTPRRRTPRARRILWWQLYPVAFLAVTWIRGGITGWYPYEFLDPTASSWTQVLVTTAVVLIAFLLVAAAIHLLEGRLRRREAPAGSEGARSAEHPLSRAPRR